MTDHRHVTSYVNINVKFFIEYRKPKVSDWRMYWYLLLEEYAAKGKNIEIAENL